MDLFPRSFYRQDFNLFGRSECRSKLTLIIIPRHALSLTNLAKTLAKEDVVSDGLLALNRVILRFPPTITNVSETDSDPSSDPDIERKYNLSTMLLM
jgi:hypothetical protein